MLYNATYSLGCTGSTVYSIYRVLPLLMNSAIAVIEPLLKSRVQGKKKKKEKKNLNSMQMCRRQSRARCRSTLLWCQSHRRLSLEDCCSPKFWNQSGQHSKQNKQATVTKMTGSKSRFQFVFLLVLEDKDSLHSPGSPGTHSIDEAGLELRDRPTEYWD